MELIWYHTADLELSVGLLELSAKIQKIIWPSNIKNYETTEDVSSK